MFFNRILLLVIFLVAIGFFNVAFLSDSFIKLLRLFFVVLMLASIIFRYMYGYVEKRRKNFLLPVVLILTGVFLSSIIAYAYHGQGFFITFWAHTPMYWFVLYFFLSVNEYRKKDIENLIMVFAILYSIFYLVQFFAYPTILFDVRLDDDPVRGTLRIFLPGYAVLALGYCMNLNKFLFTNRLNYLWPLLLFFSVTLLQASRQYILGLLVITLYAIIFSKRVRSRGLIIFLITLSALPIYLIFQDLIMNIIDISARATRGTDPSASQRPTTIMFFLFEFFPSNSAYILGNGEEHGSSPYGEKMNFLRSLHLYLSDIGIIGEYVRFGVFFVIGAFMTIVKLFKFKAPVELNYIRYYALYVVIILPLARFFSSSINIALLCFLFYFIDLELEKVKQFKANKRPDPTGGNAFS